MCLLSLCSARANADPLHCLLLPLIPPHLPPPLPSTLPRVAMGAINGAVWGSLVAALGLIVVFNFLRS